MTLPPPKAQYLADQLGQVREEIKVLKAREAALRDALMEARPNAPINGENFTATIRRSTRRRFDKTRLPEHIHDDPQYWKETQSVTVLVRANKPAADAEVDLIEPI